MRVKDPTVVEVQELLLPSALDARVARPDERAKLRGLEPSAQRGMQHAHANDGASARA
jgi:hypothetical protein